MKLAGMATIRIANVAHLRIDNSGHSMNCVSGHISETSKCMIKCNTSNNWAYFSLSFDINNGHIIFNSQKL